MKSLKVLLLAVLVVGLVAAAGLADSKTWTSSFTIADCVTVNFGGDLNMPSGVEVCDVSGWFESNEATGDVTANCNFHVYYDVKPFTHSADAACILKTEIAADFNGQYIIPWYPVGTGLNGDFWAYVGCPDPGAPNNFLPGTLLSGSGQLRVLRSGMSDRAGTYTARVAVTVAW